MSSSNPELEPEPCTASTLREPSPRNHTFGKSRISDCSNGVRRCRYSRNASGSVESGRVTENFLLACCGWKKFPKPGDAREAETEDFSVFYIDQ